jgi:hypothetical protein
LQCIIEAAEALAEEAETNVTRPVNYNSAKCSTFVDLETGNETVSELVSCERDDDDERPSDLYNNITVTPDLHFFGIPISTNTSSVHMPTDIYDYREDNSNIKFLLSKGESWAVSFHIHIDNLDIAAFIVIG